MENTQILTFAKKKDFSIDRKTIFHWQTKYFTLEEKAIGLYPEGGPVVSFHKVTGV